MNSKEIQRRFIDCIRTGNPNGPYGTKTSALVFYHKHLLKKLQQSLESSFPLTKQAMGSKAWLEAVSNFFLTCSTCDETFEGTYFGFSQYLSTSPFATKPSFFYLKDLVTFEYLLLKIEITTDLTLPSFIPEGNRLEEPIVLYPIHHLVHFEYPVFTHVHSQLSQKKGAYYLLIYRHPTLLTVELVELSALYFHMLKKISQEKTSLLTAAHYAASHLDFSIDELDAEEMLMFFDSLQQQQFILGFYNE